MCLYPTFRRNGKYKINKKNKGVIPPLLDKRVLLVPTKCGNCMECMKAKAREWKLRIAEDVRENKNGKFTTLTFSNESIRALSQEEGLKTLRGYILDNAIAKLAVRRFLERWRKKHGKSVRHWLVTELGHNGTENIHLHGIIWTDEKIEEIRERWNYGFIYPKKDNKTPNYVNEKTATYITKYLSKKDLKHKEYKPKMFVSAGIGKGYAEREDAERNEYKGEKTITTYKSRNGTEQALPIYWRNQIYSEDEREKLWLHMLDKNERYVGGEKIDVSENDDDYWGAVEHYRKINNELGYGSNEKNYDQKRYENELRWLKQKERIKKR